MSEPRSRARKVQEVVPGLLRWKVADERIGGAESDSYALRAGARVTFVDPLPLVGPALRRLGEPEAIVLTAACHQRSAWRLRRLLRIPVCAPERVPVGEAAGQLLEEPDRRYGDGARLPAGLTAIHAPGPAIDMYALWHEPTRAVFLTDLLTHDGSGTPEFVPAEYQDDAALTRQSVQRILERLPVEVLCFDHGPPIASGARQALERALANERELLPRASPRAP